MPAARFGLGFLIVLAHISTAPSVLAQSQDPFGQRNSASDPFGPQPVARGKPIQVTFRVHDESDQPVGGATIRGPFVGRAVTDENGKAVLRLTDQQLRKAAAGTRVVKFTVFPPRQRVMAKTFVRRPVKQLLTGPTVDAKLRDGVKLVGQVVGKQDKKPIKHVRIYVASTSFANTLRSDYFTETDEQGKWSMVIPPVDSTVAAVGNIAGYRISRERPYTQDVTVVGAKQPISVPSIEVEQLPTQSVLVTTEAGESISDATVQGWYEHWLSDQHVMLEQLSDREVTGADGMCQLRMHDLEWTKAYLQAERQINGITHSGRVYLESEDSKELITIKLRRSVKVSGRLLSGSNPVANVEVAIVELLPVKDERKLIYIGRRGEAKTNASGGYEFQVAAGAAYAILYYDAERLKEAHRIPTIRAADSVKVPAIDIRTVNKN